MIREEHSKGISVSDIANEMGISRPTVRKYLKAKRSVVHTRKTNVSILEPYKAYTKVRIDRYNVSAVRILEEIRKKGYEGGYSTLKSYCATLKKDLAINEGIRFETEPGRQEQVDLGGIRAHRDGWSVEEALYILIHTWLFGL